MQSESKKCEKLLVLFSPAQILPHFPRIEKLGKPIERRVDRVIAEEKEKRQDLYILAMG